MQTITVESFNGKNELVVGGIKSVNNHRWAHRILIEGMVRMDGSELSAGSVVIFPEGSVCRIPEKDIELTGCMELLVTEIFTIIVVFKQEAEIEVHMNELSKIVESDENADINFTEVDLSYDSGTITGTIGPLNFSLGINMNRENFTESYFFMGASVFGVKIVDAKLDIHNTHYRIGTEIKKCKVTGEVGVDFDKGEVYIEVEIKLMNKTLWHERCVIFSWG
ncbi:MAG: hypothetical protein IK016_01790 [Lachnospiraceae bacterium]|nr:hypothetical protein [Lachnospiraceae bacterium]